SSRFHDRVECLHLGQPIFRGLNQAAGRDRGREGVNHRRILIGHLEFQVLDQVGPCIRVRSGTDRPQPRDRLMFHWWQISVGYVDHAPGSHQLVDASERLLEAAIDRGQDAVGKFQAGGQRQIDAGWTESRPSPDRLGLSAREEPRRADSVTSDVLFGNRHVDRQVSPWDTKGQQKEPPPSSVELGGGSWKDSGDNRPSRQSTIMGSAGLTAVFGMGTGVTPPVWSPENRPAGCQATPAAIPRWSVTGTKSSRHTRSSGTSARTKTNPLAFVICHLPFAICHSDRIGEATGSPWLALLRWSREPIGVVKLLGC